jgi:hypothetical protein
VSGSLRKQVLSALAAGNSTVGEIYRHLAIPKGSGVLPTLNELWAEGALERYQATPKRPLMRWRLA